MSDTRKEEIKIVLNSIAERCATANIILATTGELYVKDKLTGATYRIDDFRGEKC